MITDRIDAVTHIPATALSVTPPIPKAVKIELTGRCNYRCGFCALATREAQPTHNLPWDLFCRMTREMRAVGVEEIGLFFIGESFLAPDLLTRAIRFLKTDVAMPYVFLTSNASLATPVVVEACMAAGLDSLKWSVNASTPEQFTDVMRVSPKLFDRALANIAEANSIRDRGGYATRLSASSIRYDGDQHARMEALLETHVRPYVDEHYWLPLYSMGSLALAAETALGYTPSPGNRGRLGALVDPLPCWSCFTEGHVLSDGRLSACCFDATGDWIMGDLTTQSFVEAWQSAPFQALRAAHLQGDVSQTTCANCVACGAGA